MIGDRQIAQRIYELQGPVPALADFGKKIYVVKAGNNDCKYFTEKCPVCVGTKEIEVRGFKMKCPYCSNPYNSGPFGKTAERIRIQNYVVEEYVVHELVLSGPDRKNAYSQSQKTYEDRPRVSKIRAFQRTANGYNNVTYMDVPTDDRLVDPDPKRVVSAGTWESYVFTRKPLAETVCGLLMKAECEKLDDFNKEHGTAHAFPF